ncbi:hypothetical protein BDK51DRAFT_37750 [Blyttiomyces helicus]|uniref:Uncharacterized protein n=1 Tax=Blyttiomyces helicus TaxID=388810 RepID=A0A4P9W1V8_9FUNG|nr:hypothetical protein BDK51DRAFT_37750 [Blyttiomyces helicus]|eukprot:RKO86181.1 hypothetical protein BDK51DRAFT_37750 [Blyttiomyces helicus]
MSISSHSSLGWVEGAVEIMAREALKPGATEFISLDLPKLELGRLHVRLSGLSDTAHSASRRPSPFSLVLLFDIYVLSTSPRPDMHSRPREEPVVKDGPGVEQDGAEGSETCSETRLFTAICSFVAGLERQSAWASSLANAVLNLVLLTASQQHLLLVSAESDEPPPSTRLPRPNPATSTTAFPPHLAEAYAEIGDKTYRTLLCLLSPKVTIPLFRRVGSRLSFNDAIRTSKCECNSSDTADGRDLPLPAADLGPEWEPIPDMFRLIYAREAGDMGGACADFRSEEVGPVESGVLHILPQTDSVVKEKAVMWESCVGKEGRLAMRGEEVQRAAEAADFNRVDDAGVDTVVSARFGSARASHHPPPAPAIVLPPLGPFPEPVFVREVAATYGGSAMTLRMLWKPKVGTRFFANGRLRERGAEREIIEKAFEVR